MKTGYSIRTWRMRLFCSEKQILAETEKLYCEAVAFYYELLKDRNELWTENLLTIQGQLEKLAVLEKMEEFLNIFHQGENFRFTFDGPQ